MSAGAARRTSRSTEPAVAPGRKSNVPPRRSLGGAANVAAALITTPAAPISFITKFFAAIVPLTVSA